MPVGFRGDELQSLTVESDQMVLLADAPRGAGDAGPAARGESGGTVQLFAAARRSPAFGGDVVDNFYLTNLSDREANLKITLATALPILRSS